MIRADLIPAPGLWYRAPVHVDEGAPDPRDWTVMRWHIAPHPIVRDGQVRVCRMDETFVVPVSATHVLLEDNLGLGLKGLESVLQDRLEGVGMPNQVRDRLWEWEVHGDREALLQLCAHIALTDRLCAAVQLKGDTDAIASWGPTVIGGNPVWVLSCPGDVRNVAFERPAGETWQVGLERVLAEQAGVTDGR